MSNVEYKTVALSRSISVRRKRRQSEADLVAEQLGRVLNEEANDGWEYMRAETLTTPGRSGMFQKGGPAAYVVLIFRRDRSVVWRHDEAPAYQAKEQASAAPAPVRAAAPAAPPQAAAPEAQPARVAPVVPAAPPPQAAPPQKTEPEVRFGTTSVQLVSSSDGSGSVTPMRPLGSAQD